MKLRFTFECEDSQERRVREIMKSDFGIDIKRWRNGSSRYVVCGEGFGDRVWRVNEERKRVEASFSHSCYQSRALKKAGFEFECDTGVWHSPISEFSTGMCRLLRLVKIDMAK